MLFLQLHKSCCLCHTKEPRLSSYIPLKALYFPPKAVSKAYVKCTCECGGNTTLPFWISAHTERFDLSCITAFLVFFQWARSPSKAKRKQSSATFQSYVVHLLTGILLQIFSLPHCICQILSFHTTCKSTGSLFSFAHYPFQKPDTQS